MRKKKTNHELPEPKKYEVRFPCERQDSHSAHEVTDSKVKSLFGQIRHFCEGVEGFEGERAPYKAPEISTVYLDCFLNVVHTEHTKPFLEESLDNVYVGKDYPFGDYDRNGNVLRVVCLGRNEGIKFGPVDGELCRIVDQIHSRHQVNVWVPEQYIGISRGRLCPGVGPDLEPADDIFNGQYKDTIFGAEALRLRTEIAAMNRWHDFESESATTNKRADILSNAEKLINGDRADTYGPPEVSFSRIANLWNAMGFQMYEKETGPRAVNAVDVALALTQLKVSRILGQTDHEDSWTDAAGYIALGGEMAMRRATPPTDTTKE